MNVVSVLGARPQFIKAAPVSQALHQAGHAEYLLHTGQHYDYEMSQLFFDQLNIPTPHCNLEIGSGTHATQTGQILEGVERTLLVERPDVLIVYGDTNSTVAGALAAAKLQIPIAHVEAGLRSFNREMPEEHNRVVTDHCASALFCPTETAVENLKREGLTAGVELVGDTMYDILLACRDRIDGSPEILATLGVRPGEYVLATVHRAYNTDIAENLYNIFLAFSRLSHIVVLPLHPRTRAKLQQLDPLRRLGGVPGNVRIIDPVGYVDMLSLETHAKRILTDSGGVQKEAYLLGVPCITMRPETEWVETAAAGWNVVTDRDPDRIVAAVHKTDWPTSHPPSLFGGGDAGSRIVESLERRFVSGAA